MFNSKFSLTVFLNIKDIRLKSNIKCIRPINRDPKNLEK